MIKRKLFPALILCIIVCMSASCVQKESELQKNILEYNKDCPQSLGDVGEISSITYEDGDVVVIFTINEQVVNLMAFESNVRMLRQAMLNSFKNSTGDLREIVDLVIEEEANIVVKYVGSITNKTIELKITYEDLKKNVGKADSPEQAALEALKSRIEVLNSQLPAQMDEGMVLTNATIEKDYVVYNISVDEQKYPIAEIEKERSQREANLKTWLTVSGRSTAEMAKLCKEAGKGIAHRYTGDKSEKTCLIGIPASDL